MLPVDATLTRARSGAIALIAVAFIALILLPSAAFADDVKADSTVEIIRISDGHLGAGVQIKPGLIITAAHVVSVDRTVTIKDDKGRTETGTILSSDPKDNLAFVSVSPSADLAVSPLSCFMPAVGSPVVMIGHPFGHTFISMPAHILTGLKSVSPWPSLILIDRRGLPGMSGGPVFDTQGSVVGMVVAATGPGYFPMGPAGALPDIVICNILATL